MVTEDETWTFIIDGVPYQLPRDPFFELWCALFVLVPLGLVARTWRLRYPVVGR